MYKFICNFDNLPLISLSDILNINKLTLIPKIIIQCDVKHIMTYILSLICLARIDFSEQSRI